MTSYINIERQYDVPLAIKYDSHEQAEAAVTNSPFIDRLCEKDSLALWVSKTYLPGAEVITPPEEPAPDTRYVRSLPQQSQREVQQLLTQHLEGEGLSGKHLTKHVKNGMDSKIADLDEVIPVYAVVPPPARARAKPSHTKKP